MRLSGAAVLGFTMAFLLAVIMRLLILKDEGTPGELTARKISGVWFAERQITPYANIIKPEKPEEPEPIPPEFSPPEVAFEMDLEPVIIAPPDISFTQDIVRPRGFARDIDYIPLYVPQPQYPGKALLNGKEGYAVIQVTITTAGEVRDPLLIEEYPVDYGFGRAASEAALKLKYSPRIINGKPEEVAGVLYKFSFRLEE